MEFCRKIDGDVVTEKIKDVGEDRAMYESQFFGGSVKWYGGRDVEIIGRHNNIVVKARVYAPGKVSMSFERA